jgi:hypothetical protein
MHHEDRDLKQKALKNLKDAVEEAANLVPGLLPRKPKVTAGWLLTKEPFDEIVTTISEWRLPTSMNREHRDVFESRRKKVLQELREAWDEYRKVSDPEATVPLSDD